jgi:metal-sulfur cluster biosynthetic enzyme
MNCINPSELTEKRLQRLGKVIDPETGVDVVRMHLIEDLNVTADGMVTYKFRPSSALCPLAIPLSLEIQKAVSEVPGVTDQELEIVGYLKVEELAELIRQQMEQDRARGKDHEKSGQDL